MNRSQRCILVLLTTTCLVSVLAPTAWPQEPKIDTGDTAWILASSALVMVMVLPGQGVASGIIAGRATITPGAGFVGPLSAMVIGALGGAACYLAVVWKARFGYDELPRRGRHSRCWWVPGYLGDRIACFKRSHGAGLFFGNPAQFGIQAVAGVVTFVFCFGGTYIILKVVDAIVGLRVSPEEEELGLDLSQHSERAYT